MLSDMFVTVIVMQVTKIFEIEVKKFGFLLQSSSLTMSVVQHSKRWKMKYGFVENVIILAP